MISEISLYMREQGAKCAGIETELVNGNEVKNKFFVDKNGNYLGTMRTASIKTSSSARHYESDLYIPRAQMSSETVKEMDYGVLSKYKGRKNVLFPKSVQSRVISETPNEIKIVKSISLVPKGLKLLRNENGMLVYQAYKNFSIKKFNLIESAAKLGRIF